jgi:hypothetical protein
MSIPADESARSTCTTIDHIPYTKNGKSHPNCFPASIEPDETVYKMELPTLDAATFLRL